MLQKFSEKLTYSEIVDYLGRNSKPYQRPTISICFSEVTWILKLLERCLSSPTIEVIKFWKFSKQRKWFFSCFRALQYDGSMFVDSLWKGRKSHVGWAVMGRLGEHFSQFRLFCCLNPTSPTIRTRPRLWDTSKNNNTFLHTTNQNTIEWISHNRIAQYFKIWGLPGFSSCWHTREERLNHDYLSNFFRKWVISLWMN